MNMNDFNQSVIKSFQEIKEKLPEGYCLRVIYVEGLLDDPTYIVKRRRHGTLEQKIASEIKIRCTTYHQNGTITEELR